MKRVIYKNCNNNAGFLKKIFIQVQAFSDIELSWSISNLEFIPVYKGDFIEGQAGNEIERIYDFQKKAINEHTVHTTHGAFIDLLGDVKTIYEGSFMATINDKQIKIKVFDGDIIEVEGNLEDELDI